MMERMGKVASSPVIAILGAGAALANPGAFIPIALKDISETDPSASEYIVDWVFFSLASLLPLAIALVLLLVAREWTMGVLRSARDWLQLHAMTVAAVLVVVARAIAAPQRDQRPDELALGGGAPVPDEQPREPQDRDHCDEGRQSQCAGQGGGGGGADACRDAIRGTRASPHPKRMMPRSRGEPRMAATDRRRVLTEGARWRLDLFSSSCWASSTRSSTARSSRSSSGCARATRCG